MKKELQYIIRMMCLMILAVLLSSCGKASDGLDDQSSSGSHTGEGSRGLPEGYVYSARFEDAGGETEIMPGASLSGDFLYYYISIYDQEWEGLVQEVYVQEEGKEAQHLTSFGKGDGKFLKAMARGEDGFLYFLYSENKEENEPQIYVLEKRDQELKIIYSVDTTDSMEDILGIYNLEAGLDGILYGLTYDGIVLCWDEAEGIYRGRFTLPENTTTVSVAPAGAPHTFCFGLVNAGPYGVYAYGAGGKQESATGIRLYHLEEWREMNEAGKDMTAPLLIDFETMTEEVLSGQNGTFFVFSGYEDGLYMADGNQMWRIDLADGSLEPLMAWEDFGLEPWYVRAVRLQEDDSFLIHIFDTLEQENYWVTLAPIHVSELPEKHELVLGVAGILNYNMSLTAKVEQLVLAYNRTHPYCHIIVREYGENGITNFQTELLTGKGPDILLERESFFDMETLAGKGIVEDLTPYLSESEQEILPGIMQLAMKDGKIPRIPMSFSVYIMILPEDRCQDVMTPQEMVEFIEDSSYKDYMVYPTDFLLKILFGAEMDHYVDKDAKTCSFDSEEFVSLLESLNQLRNMETIGSRGKRAEFFCSGQLNAVVEEMDCLKDYFCIRETFSGVGGIAGFPNSRGELRYPVILYDWMGINSATEYKEDAWEFIEFCLSYMSHYDDVEDRFVVTKDKFNRQTRLEKAALYFFSAWNDYDENWSEFHTIEPLTQEETELLWEISENLYLYEDNDLMNVIREEASAFFSGDISAKEAAGRIQNRAALIVGE